MQKQRLHSWPHAWHTLYCQSPTPNKRSIRSQALSRSRMRPAWHCRPRTWRGRNPWSAPLGACPLASRSRPQASMKILMILIWPTIKYESSFLTFLWWQIDGQSRTIRGKQSGCFLRLEIVEGNGVFGLLCCWKFQKMMVWSLLSGLKAIDLVCCWEKGLDRLKINWKTYLEIDLETYSWLKHLSLVKTKFLWAKFTSFSQSKKVFSWLFWLVFITLLESKNSYSDSLM